MLQVQKSISSANDISNLTCCRGVVPTATAPVCGRQPPKGALGEISRVGERVNTEKISGTQNPIIRKSDRLSSDAM